ncbi:MAG: VOC family protein [Nevskia sp.]|nr:VOC family protein [Nevskia sp.]
MAQQAVKIDALAYVVAESTDVSKWKQFGEEVLGLASSEAPEGGLYLKMDERKYRIAVVKGQADRYFASGWEVSDENAFKTAVDALKKAGVKLTAGSEAERKARCVQDLAAFTDPSGNRHELSWGFTTDFARFVSPAGVEEFITGDAGVGHTVLPAEKFDETWALFRDTLGFGLSDIFRHKFTPDPDEPVKRIFFTHCANPRHHSLALFEMAIPSGCVHMMIEVPSMDEVGRAYDRMQKHGVKLMATLGRHVNDRMTSFYMNSPSNFAIEFGYGGLMLDWDKHQAFESTAVSLWGHDFSVGFK